MRLVRACALALLALLAACSSSGSSAGPGPANPSSAPASPPTTAAASSAPPSPAASSSPTGGPVPTGFVPVSVSAVSADQAWVLGTAPCSVKPCTSIVATTDGFHTFHGLAAPKAPLVIDVAKVSDGVRGLRFGDPKDGYAFSPELYATHDGSRSWTKVVIEGQVLDLTISQGYTYVTTTACQSLAGCRSSDLLRAPSGGDGFAAVTHFNGYAGALSFHGSVGYALVVTDKDEVPVLYRTGDGTTWTRQSDPCARAQGDQAGDHLEATAVSPVDDTRAFLLCGGNGAAGSEGKVVLTTSDAGSTWSQAGTPPFGGDVDGIAAASPTTLVVGAASGSSELYRSTDAGHTWSEAVGYGDQGLGFRDLGFTTPTQGFAVRGAPQVKEGKSSLILTKDAGAHWSTVTIT